MENELNFSLENELEASAHLNIYLNHEKHLIQIWNYAASDWKDEKGKGLIIYYDEEEFKTLDELYTSKFIHLPKYFKIELLDMDDEYLNEYKKSHPELNIEDY